MERAYPSEPMTLTHWQSAASGQSCGEESRASGVPLLACELAFCSGADPDRGSRTADPGQRTPLQPEHLAGIHSIVGIERALDRFHHLEGIAMLLGEVIHLAEPDAMFTRARPAHLQRAVHQA